MHLWARWGDKIKQVRDMHHFMAWDGLIMGQLAAADSDYSAKLVGDKLCFHSHVSGDKLLLTPAEYMQIQQNLNIDLILSYAYMQALPGSAKRASEAMAMTVHWAEQCQQVHDNKSTALLAVIPGGADASLQADLITRLCAMNFNGYMFDQATCQQGGDEMMVKQFPDDALRGLLYVATLEQLIAAVYAGVDLIHSHMPMQMAARGELLTSQGIFYLTAAQDDNSHDAAIDNDCHCYTCTHFSRAYLRYLYTINIGLGKRLSALHNHFFCEYVMFCLRAGIEQGNMPDFAGRLVGTRMK